MPDSVRNYAIEEFINMNIAETVSLLEELGKIPAPSHQEDKRAAFCRDWFLANGCPDVRIDEAKNVICGFGLDKYEDIVVFMAHTDVVFDDLTPLPMRREGNKLYAPGIGDDTANLVNLMMGLRYLTGQTDRLKKAVLIIANACEEGLGNLDGSKRICKDYGTRITEFYTFDGYTGQCTDVPVGSHRYRITVYGEGGHSYVNFGRSNAIHAASELISALYKIEVPSASYTTYNVGKISGGSTVNSIAQECEFLYEYRSESEECLQIMKAALEKTLEEFRTNGMHIDTELLGVRPGIGQIDREGFRRWTDANIEILKNCIDDEPDRRAASTDANIPLSMGIFANCIGTIRGADAHKREEWVDLDSLPEGMRIVLNFIEHCLKQDN